MEAIIVLSVTGAESLSEQYIRRSIGSAILLPMESEWFYHNLPRPLDAIPDVRVKDIFLLPEDTSAYSIVSDLLKACNSFVGAFSDDDKKVSFVALMAALGEARRAIALASGATESPLRPPDALTPRT